MKIKLIAALSLISLIISNTFADITVIGKGTIDVKPNIATFNISIETKALTAKDAASKNANQTSKTIKTLKSILQSDDAITTQGYSVYPESLYDDKDKKFKFVGFTVTNMIHVKTNKIAGIGEILDQAANSGITTINNLSFSYNKPYELYNKALVLAISNAKNQAEVIAKAGNMQLKEIKDVSALANTEYNRPMPMYAMADAKSVATPIEAPDVKTEASVQVIFKT